MMIGMMIFQRLQPLDLITKDARELQKFIKEKKENLRKDRFETNDKEKESKHKHELDHSREREQAKEKKEEKITRK